MYAWCFLKHLNTRSRLCLSSAQQSWTSSTKKSAGLWIDASSLQVIDQHFQKSAILGSNALAILRMRGERGVERGEKREERGEEREERIEERGEKREVRRGERGEERGEKREKREQRREDDPRPKFPDCCRAWGAYYLCNVRVMCLHSGSWIPSGFLLPCFCCLLFSQGSSELSCSKSPLRRFNQCSPPLTESQPARAIKGPCFKLQPTLRIDVRSEGTRSGGIRPWASG